MHIAVVWSAGEIVCAGERELHGWHTSLCHQQKWIQGNLLGRECVFRSSQTEE